MKIKNSRRNENKFMIVILLIIILFIGITIIYNHENNKTIESYKAIEIELKDKNQTIDSLENEIKKLEKTVEELKVAKAAKDSMPSADTVLTSAKISTNEKWIWANVSAYCACIKCCGKTDGITASGTKATAGKTIAAPKQYAFGTKIEIAGMGTYVVEDRGGAITGNKLDVYFDSHSEALKFGRRQLQIRVIM